MSSQTQSSGKLIVFEGMDGCGKSTHAKLLSAWITKKGLAVLHTKEPSKGGIGLLLRKYLKKGVPPLVDALLFTADRAEHVESEIKPALSEGKIVICERYIYSTIAYQAAQGLDWKWLEELNSFAPKPDAVILLDMRPDIAHKRTSTKEKFETAGFLTKVRQNYLKLAQENNFFIVDVTGAKTKVQEEIRNIAEKIISS
jgi:dTMP kinase